MNILEHKDAI